MKIKLLVILALVVGLVALSAAIVYTYKCPKCGLIQQYSMPNPGTKCPNDGWIMNTVW